MFTAFPLTNYNQRFIIVIMGFPLNTRDNRKCWVCGQAISKDIAKKLGTPIAMLGLSRRALNVLDRRGIETVEHLISFREDELLRFVNMGKYTCNEIKIRLKSFGFARWE